MVTELQSEVCYKTTFPPTNFGLPMQSSRIVLILNTEMIYFISAVSHRSYNFFGYFISSASIVSQVISCTLTYSFILWSVES